MENTGKNEKLLKFDDFVNEGNWDKAGYDKNDKEKQIKWVLDNQALLYGDVAFWKEEALTAKTSEEVAHIFNQIKAGLGEIAESKKVNEDGYGALPFFVSKNGDSFNYLFKIDVDDAHKSIAFVVGKFSKFAQPTEGKTEYAVLSTMELPEEKLDQAVVDKGNFEPTNKEFAVSERQLNRILEIEGQCIADYLQKNPKVSRFYDEQQAFMKNPEYNKRLQLSLDKWVGGPGTWHLQEVDAGKLNIIIK